MEWNWKLGGLQVLFIILVSRSLCLCWSLNDEGLALLRLRERVVSDPFDALKNWKSSDTENDPCSWFGVGCYEGKVVILNLKDLCLEGSLAPELRRLTHIKSIILRNNSFSGIIPEGFGELKELEVLDLGYNNFSGPLPSDLGINESLTILLLDNNEILGGLSPEIYELQMISESQVDEALLSSAAKKGLSCGKRFITWNDVQNEVVVRRRLLQESPMVNLSGTAGESTPSPAQSPSDTSPPRASVAPPDSDTSNFPAPTPPLDPPPSPILNPSKSERSSSKSAILGGTIGGAVLLLILIIVIYLYRCNKVSTVRPWATGLSGQLQKAFVTGTYSFSGVPKLKRSELEAACEDFSNVIGSSPIGMVYKGTLSSGVEISVASVEVASAKDWSKNLEMQFRKKIDTLSKVNHKNFVNLIGYCEEEETFTRMMVFEYAPNGTLFEHLHVRESEHLNWGMRMRIAMGMAHCLEYMHQLNLPIAHNNLNSPAVHLTEDYAAKLSDLSFRNEISASEMKTAGTELSDTPSASLESNVYSFGVLLFEMMTGRMPYTVNDGCLEDWASDYLRGNQPLKRFVDPTLRTFDVEQLEKFGDLIKACVLPNLQLRPSMRDVTARLREITGITQDGAIPKLSPLWWAELEILSADAV
ncbi:probable inactive receptor-like protein kinase At3g56050 isoform X2 [Mangifera indica]|uniref:probable inactive receptor-like protein kinase At3g56050 isoform X2 n=1 Tax=Mangifera indica TaxID=29780 RepID=UPI001CFAC084|nr:probable inactive receptor-like protein kinase At3g56050 isoform X2 [Mangifera indica]